MIRVQLSAGAKDVTASQLRSPQDVLDDFLQQRDVFAEKFNAPASPDVVAQTSAWKAELAETMNSLQEVMQVEGEGPFMPPVSFAEDHVLRTVSSSPLFMPIQDTEGIKLKDIHRFALEVFRTSCVLKLEQVATISIYSDGSFFEDLVGGCASQPKL